MKRNDIYLKTSNDKSAGSPQSVIGLYEMLAQAQTVSKNEQVSSAASTGPNSSLIKKSNE